MRPLSQDLRQRIIAARARGEGTGDVCQRFGVSRKSVERFWKQHRLTGACQPKKIGGYRRSRLEKHDRTLRRWLTAAALQGHAPAMVILGGLLLQHSSDSSDLVQAVDLFRRAAALGNLDAQYNLGVCLRQAA